MIKINVTIVAGTDPDVHKTGGINLYVSNLIKRLSELGIQITFIGISYSAERRAYPFTFIPVAQNVRSGFRYLFYLFFKALTLQLPANSIIHAQSPAEIFPFVLFHRKNPKICRLFGRSTENIRMLHGRFVAWIYSMVEKFALRHVDRCIAVSENVKQDFIREYPWLRNKIDVVFAGVNLNLFKPMEGMPFRKKYGFGEEDKIILYVGRLEVEKNLGFLIKAFVHVKERDGNAKLVLVGDGRDKSNLERLVTQVRARDVIFLGTMEHKKIPEIMNCADVVALCSLNEGSPAAVKEALACGVPVVSTDVGDVKNWIKSGVGRITERDEQKFAQAILEMLAIDKNKIRKACEDISRNFSFDITVRKTIDTYRSVIKTKR